MTKIRKEPETVTITRIAREEGKTIIEILFKDREEEVEEEEIVIADIIIILITTTTIIIIKISEIIIIEAIIIKMTKIKVETEIEMIDRTIRIIDKRETIMMITGTEAETKIEVVN